MYKSFFFLLPWFIFPFIHIRILHRHLRKELPKLALVYIRRQVRKDLVLERRDAHERIHAELHALRGADRLLAHREGEVSGPELLLHVVLVPEGDLVDGPSARRELVDGEAADVVHLGIVCDGKHRGPLFGGLAFVFAVFRRIQDSKELIEILLVHGWQIRLLLSVGTIGIEVPAPRRFLEQVAMQPVARVLDDDRDGTIGIPEARMLLRRPGVTGREGRRRRG